jgi:hypothetical protein
MKISRVWHRSRPPRPRTPDAFDWRRLADGRPRRLERDVHFVGSVQAFAAVVQTAAVEMGKSVLVMPERLQPEKSLWIQFADSEIVVGDPCPCGGRRLERVGGRVLRCDACARTLVTRDAGRARGAREANAGGRSVSVSEAAQPPQTGARSFGVRMSDDPAAGWTDDRPYRRARVRPALSEYTSVRLVPWGRSRFVGVGIDANGTETLLIARTGRHDDLPRLPVDDPEGSASLEIVFSLSDPWARLSVRPEHEKQEFSGP